MSDYASFRIGAFDSPLVASTAHSLLQDADPALYGVIRYYQAVLSIHLGARFDLEVARAGLPALVGKVSTLAIPYDPVPYLTQAQIAPPFLAVYVTSEVPRERTRNWYTSDEQWKLLWVLPPLNAAQHLQLSPMLRAVGKVVLDRTEQGHDPAYASDDLVFQTAGVAEIKIERISYGGIQKVAQGVATEMFFPTIEVDLTLSEIKRPTPGLQAISGMDVDVTAPGGGASYQQDLT